MSGEPSIEVEGNSYERRDSTRSNSGSDLQRKTTDPYLNWQLYQSSKIQITLDRPVIKEELFNYYLLYKISGSDQKGSFETNRRYSDFQKVRNLLVIRWPGCFVPSLPPKLIDNLDKSHVEERWRHLESFCKQIAEAPHLFYSDVFQIFLRTRLQDLDAIMQPYHQVQYSDIVKRYSKVFPHLVERELNVDTIYKIVNFSAFLQRVQGQFEKQKTIAKNFMVARKKFLTKLVATHDMMSMGYERQVFSEYHDFKPKKNVFYDPSNQKINEGVEKVREAQKEDSVEHIYRWIVSEQAEIEAFREAFAQREKYEAIKKTPAKGIQSLMSSKPSAKNIQNADDLDAAKNMISAVIAYGEIDKFKKARVEKYYKMVELAGRNELNCLNAVSEYWEGFSDNDNIKNVDL